MNKQGFFIQYPSKDHLGLMYSQNEEGHFKHCMERLSSHSVEAISIQCLQALCNRDKISKNEAILESIRYRLVDSFLAVR